jgi:hypothetical protein
MNLRGRAEGRRRPSLRCADARQQVFSGYPEADSDVEAPSLDLRLEGGPFLGSHFVVAVDNQQRHLGAVREIGRLVDHDMTALDAGVQRRHAFRLTLLAGDGRGLGHGPAVRFSS